MPHIAFLFSILLIGCGFQYSYEGEMRGDVATDGLHQTLQVYDREARSGEGEDLFRLYLLIEEMGHRIPNYSYSSDDGLDSILNCAAETGFDPAIEEAVFHMSARRTPAAEAAIQCVERLRSRGGVASDQIWRRCEAQRQLPKCPAEFQNALGAAK